MAVLCRAGASTGAQKDNGTSFYLRITWARRARRVHLLVPRDMEYSMPIGGYTFIFSRVASTL